MLEYANQESCDDVDRSDHDSRQCVALTEACRAVHRAVKLGFAGNLFAPASRLCFVNQSGVQVGINCHLFAWHCVQRETCGYFRGTDRSVADDHVLNGNQCKEEHESIYVIPYDHELSERFDNFSRGCGTFASVQQNAPAASEIK